MISPREEFSVLNARGRIFALVFVFVVVVGMTFHTKRTNQEYTRCSILTSLFYHPPPPLPNPKSTMSSPVVNAKEGMKMTKQTKTKIGVGSVVEAKVGELEKITREGISRRTTKEVVGCVQSVVGKNNFLFLF